MYNKEVQNTVAAMRPTVESVAICPQCGAYVAVDLKDGSKRCLGPKHHLQGELVYRTAVLEESSR